MDMDIPDEILNRQRSPAFTCFLQHWFVDSRPLSRGEVSLDFLRDLKPDELDLARSLLRQNLGLKYVHVIEGVATLNDVDSIPILREMMKSETDLSRQLTIAGALWKLAKDPIFVECLHRMKAARNARIKTVHIRQILWLNDERALDLLIDLLDDGDKFVGVFALQILNELEFERRFFVPPQQLPSQPDDYRARRTIPAFRSLMTAHLLASNRSSKPENRR